MTARVNFDKETSTESVNPRPLTTEELSAAKVLGIGAVKYADLTMNRESNYRFSFKKVRLRTTIEPIAEFHNLEKFVTFVSC